MSERKFKPGDRVRNVSDYWWTGTRRLPIGAVVTVDEFKERAHAEYIRFKEMLGEYPDHWRLASQYELAELPLEPGCMVTIGDGHDEWPVVRIEELIEFNEVDALVNFGQRARWLPSKMLHVVRAAPKPEPFYVNTDEAEPQEGDVWLEDGVIHRREGRNTVSVFPKRGTAVPGRHLLVRDGEPWGQS